MRPSWSSCTHGPWMDLYKLPCKALINCFFMAPPHKFPPPHHLRLLSQPSWAERSQGMPRQSRQWQQEAAAQSPRLPAAPSPRCHPLLQGLLLLLLFPCRVRPVVVEVAQMVAGLGESGNCEWWLTAFVGWSWPAGRGWVERRMSVGVMVAVVDV